MKGFKFEPVRWVTGALAIVTALIGTNELPGVHLVPDGATPWLLLIEAVLAAVLGELARNRVTPLAAPRSSAGERMVPLSFLTKSNRTSTPLVRDVPIEPTRG